MLTSPSGVAHSSPNLYFLQQPSTTRASLVQVCGADVPCARSRAGSRLTGARPATRSCRSRAPIGDGAARDVTDARRLSLTPAPQGGLARGVLRVTECLFGGDLSQFVFCRRGTARSSRVEVGECGMFVKSWNTPRRVALQRTEGGWGREEGGNGFRDSGVGGGGGEFCAILISARYRVSGGTEVGVGGSCFISAAS